MPRIAYFLGITVTMYYNDHQEPHVHARYQGFRARVRIADGQVMDGRLPVAVARIMRDWVNLRRDHLTQNWQAARDEEPLEWIEGPE